MLKTKILILAVILSLPACAVRSPQTLAKEEPIFEYTGNQKDFPKFTECLFKKMEVFPVVGQLFDFEENTIPVQIRQFADNAELYQAIQSSTISLVKLEKINSNQIQTKLYVGNSFYDGKIKKEYPTLIKGCYER